MSKQSEAKDRQGYVEKVVPETCANCSRFLSDMVVIPAYNEWCKPYTKEKNLRCALGGFAVKKQATCNSFERVA